jgi:hypothetical protein
MTKISTTPRVRRQHWPSESGPPTLPRCAAVWTDSDGGLDRYRTTLELLGWRWSAPSRKKEQVAA